MVITVAALEINIPYILVYSDVTYKSLVVITVVSLEINISYVHVVGLSREVGFGAMKHKFLSSNIRKLPKIVFYPCQNVMKLQATTGTHHYVLLCIIFKLCKLASEGIPHCVDYSFKGLMLHIMPFVLYCFGQFKGVEGRERGLVFYIFFVMLVLLGRMGLG